MLRGLGVSVWWFTVTAESVLQAGRAAAAAYLLTSRVRVHRTTGRVVQDEDTGREVPEWVVPYEDLPFRLKRSGGVRTVTVGGVEMQLAVMDGEFPADTSDLRGGDFLEVTAGEHVGDVWRIVEAAGSDLTTRLRLPLIEARRPGEWP